MQQKQGILFDNKELKKLIEENPELPLIVFATEDCNTGNYAYELCSLKCEKGNVLDAPKAVYIPKDDRIYTDIDDLEDDITNALSDEEECVFMTEEEFEMEIKERMKALEPYWKECIILYVDSF